MNKKYIVLFLTLFSFISSQSAFGMRWWKKQKKLQKVQLGVKLQLNKTEAFLEIDGSKKPKILSTLNKVYGQVIRIVFINCNEKKNPTLIKDLYKIRANLDIIAFINCDKLFVSSFFNFNLLFNSCIVHNLKQIILCDIDFKLIDLHQFSLVKKVYYSKGTSTFGIVNSRNCCKLHWITKEDITKILKSYEITKQPT